MTLRTRIRRKLRGFTLLEVLISIAILALITSLLYGAFAAMKRSKDGLSRLQDRQREARLAMTRITRELQSAYLSGHAPINQSLAVQKTVFKGERGTPADRANAGRRRSAKRDRWRFVCNRCSA